MRLSVLNPFVCPKLLYNVLSCTKTQEQSIIRIENGIRFNRRRGYGN